MADGYIYEVVYEDERGETWTAKYPTEAYDAAELHYQSLPLERYKALWQVHREPYIEQLMICNNPHGKGLPHE